MFDLFASVISFYAVDRVIFFFFKQKTAYEMRISDWSSDVCSSDLSANNASVGGAMIPLLTLGIPGSASTAVMLGAFQIYGLQPGEGLFRDQSELEIGRASCRERVCQYV